MGARIFFNTSDKHRAVFATLHHRSLRTAVKELTSNNQKQRFLVNVIFIIAVEACDFLDEWC